MRRPKRYELAAAVFGFTFIPAFFYALELFARWCRP